DVVGHGKVEEPVVVEIPHGHGRGRASGSEKPGASKGTVAVAQQNAHPTIVQERRRASIAHGEVEEAVPVDGPYRHRTGPAPGAEIPCGLEEAVAVAQEHAHGTAELVRNDEIEEAVAVYIRHGHEPGYAPRGERARVLEGAVAVAQQHACRGHEVKAA